MHLDYRGETFRRVLSQIGDVMSLLPKGVNVIALTATATSQLRVQVTKILGMKNELVVSLSPCKQNITYAVGTFNTISETCIFSNS